MVGDLVRRVVWLPSCLLLLDLHFCPCFPSHCVPRPSSSFCAGSCSWPRFGSGGARWLLCQHSWATTGAVLAAGGIVTWAAANDYPNAYGPSGNPSNRASAHTRWSLYTTAPIAPAFWALMTLVVK